MRMRVKINSPLGEYRIFPIYDINAATLLALTGAAQDITPRTAGGHGIHKFTVENNNIYTGFVGDIPNKPENSGNIFPTRHRYNYNLGGYKYLENWFESDDWEAVTDSVPPDDWGTTTAYFRVWGGEEPVGFRIVYPYLLGASSSSYDRRNTYRDKKMQTSVIFYTETGARFSVYKCSIYSGPAIISPQSWGIGTAPDNTSPTDYRIQNAGGTVLNNNLVISHTADRTSSTITTNSENVVQCFIHYIYNSVEYYGFAHVYFNSFADSAIPTKIQVIGITPDFFGGSIISGGESGQGTWGSNNQPTYSEGTFSGRSDSVTRDSTDPHSNVAQYTAISDDRVGIFGQYGGYHIYEIPHWSEYNTDFKRIMGILYGTDFWSRWANSNFNPLSAIISLGLIPFDFSTNAEVEYYQPLVVAGFNISNQFPGDPPEFPCLKSVSRVAFDVIDINKYFGGFADFAPYTQAILHLPFVGDMPIDVNSIAHGKLGVEYLCDIANGNVVAWIWTEDYTGENSQYIACAKGNCMYSLPLFSMSQDGSGLGRVLIGMVGAFAGAAYGSPAAVLGGVAAAYSGAQSAVNISGTRSGNLDGNISSISPKEVWLEIIRPKWCENMFYQKLRGIPSEMSHYINDCGQNTDSSGNPISTGIPYDGYLKISEIELDGVNATDAEKEEIEALLKAGVYIRGDELV